MGMHELACRTDFASSSRTNPVGNIGALPLVQQNVSSWQPGTLGNMFQNVSLTMGNNGNTFESRGGADPYFMPTWALQPVAGFSTINPIILVPSCFPATDQPTRVLQNPTCLIQSLETTDDDPTSTLLNSTNKLLGKRILPASFTTSPASTKKPKLPIKHNSGKPLRLSSITSRGCGRGKGRSRGRATGGRGIKFNSHQSFCDDDLSKSTHLSSGQSGKSLIC